ncbi:hypothetical protein OG369_25065 [Streptomyces sp. NBC_01221]|uniref:hypothetical protein n=1 Tax=Streptomyces sp. NBC_01221 TaxID=2903782 RepID=UPI0022543489|nr:hypothetical protein [Streptomyces sp. NBC_01221]MCX4789333.1 hypothetical protein [Streptomyces sp. NBC_01221]
MTGSEAPARRPAHTALLAELRRGIAPWTGLALALTVLVPMWSKASQWQGSWGETQNLLHSAAALLGGPLVAAAACWQGGREHRRRTAELLLSVPRGRLAQVTTAVAPIVLWAAAGYLVALAAAFAATAPYTAAGGPSVSVVAADLGFLMSIGFVGFVVGRLVRWRLIAPVSAVCAYVVLGFPGYLDASARFLSPAQEVFLEGSVPVWWFAPVLVTWTGGIAVAVLLGYAARRRHLAVVPLALAITAATVIAHTGEDLFRDDPAVAYRVCTKAAPGTPQICVRADDAPVLPQASEALRGMFSRLEGVPGAPVRYVGNGSEPQDGEAALASVGRGLGITRNRLTDPHRYVYDTALGLVNHNCSAGPGEKGRKQDERMARTTDAVISWLSGEDSPWYPDSRQLARLEAMPDAERKVWLGRFLAVPAHCTLAEVPVL